MQKQKDGLAGFAQLWLEKMWHVVGVWQSIEREVDGSHRFIDVGIATRWGWVDGLVSCNRLSLLL